MEPSVFNPATLPHSLSCAYQKARDGTMYEAYGKADGSKPVLAINNPYCTNSRANLGLLYVGVIVGLIAMWTIAWAQFKYPDSELVHEKPPYLVSFLMSFLGGGVIGGVSVLVFVMLSNMWYGVLIFLGVALGFYGLFLPVRTGFFVKWWTNWRERKTKRLADKNKMLEAKLYELQKDPRFAEALAEVDKLLEQTS